MSNRFLLATLAAFLRWNTAFGFVSFARPDIFYQDITGPRPQGVVVGDAMKQALETTDKPPDSDTVMEHVYSLAGSYLIEGSCSSTKPRHTWSLVPLSDIASIDRKAFASEGGQAWAALQSERPAFDAPFQLRAALSFEDLVCTISLKQKGPPASERGLDENLVPVLSRVLAQWAIALRHKQEGVRETWTVRLVDESTSLRIPAVDFGTDLAATQLFESVPHGTGSEIVEMVDRQGHPLGRVPRKLVHAFNLLHRGIGLFVTKDTPMDRDASSPNLSLYVHRRTDTKRIFPSLYDMFVGGVSLAGEDAVITAQREVAEELGLDTKEHLCSERLLQCVVCTAYNRCVVDLFAYCMDTSQENVTWQAEEVAWGSFVSYPVIEAAADRSILRLATRKEWPGRNPPIQSRRSGLLDGEREQYEGAAPWEEWDFVPDGLLVWEAWLRELER